MVFDREGYGGNFFYEMTLAEVRVREKIAFARMSFLRLKKRRLRLKF